MRFYDKVVMHTVPGYHDAASPDAVADNFLASEEQPAYMLDGSSVYNMKNVVTDGTFVWVTAPPIETNASVIPFSKASSLGDLMRHEGTIRSVEIEELRTDPEKDEVLYIPRYRTDDPYTSGFKVVINERGISANKYKQKIGPSFANDMRCMLRKPKNKAGEEQSTSITHKMGARIYESTDLKWRMVVENKSDDIANPLPAPVTIHSDGRIFVGDRLVEDDFQ